MKMKTGSFEATVLVNGKPVREYSHEDTIYIEGRKGSEFEIQFRNLSPKRVLVVPSVDGLSVMDGKPASETSRGYICGGNSTITIPGWRLDDANVAKFFFQDRKKSFSEQTGEGTANVGVIGFLVYEEEEPVRTETLVWPAVVHVAPRWWETYPYYPTWTTCNAVSNLSLGAASPLGTGAAYASAASDAPVTFAAKGTGSLNLRESVATPQNATLSVTRSAVRSSDTLSPSGTATASAASTTLNTVEVRASSLQDSTDLSADEAESFSLGTGFGDQASHSVTRTNFDRKASPSATLVLYYDSRRNLEKRGIQIVAEHVETAAAAPNPFPAMTTGCTPPAGWTPSGNR